MIPRSFLFAPADSEKKIAKALDSSTDAVILDLEDSVAPANKAAARGLAAETLSGLSRAPGVGARASGCGSIRSTAPSPRPALHWPTSP